MIKTTFAEFDKLSSQLPLVPVVAEILGDLDTPVTTFLKTTKGPYRFLLESVEGASQRGRFSIIGDSPYLIFKSKDKTITVKNVLDNSGFTVESDPLHVLQSLIKKYTNHLNGLPFASNGFFGFLGYDSVRHIEDLPNIAVDDTDMEDIHMFIPQKIIVFDNLTNKISIILFTKPAGNTVDSYDMAVRGLEDIIRRIRAPFHFEAEESGGLNREDIEHNLAKPEFEGMVMQAKKHIRRGDIFQIVLSQRLKVNVDVSGFQIYRGLRVVNPSPYMFYIELDGTEVVGSSPETLVKLQDGKVTVKPIAGTRKRGEDEAEDKNLIADLLADPKERAEHTMLVDLGRNDVGRIAAYGTVNVDELMAIEKYSHVIHIVSSVSGDLASHMDAVDVFKACFPAGTLSGAPKVKAMELIDKYEPTRRAIYGGAVGYMTFDGNMDVCIAIRTIFIKEHVAHLQAGAGIVADSVPEREWDETMNKANALLKSIDYAQGGLI